MQAKSIGALLRGNSYPGRGIVIGRSADGNRAVVAYFIMGRSENSRNRIFVADGEGIRTEAFDPAKLRDPSLIIYSPVRVQRGTTIVTNGDQTDTIYDFFAQDKSFVRALRTRTFEPDAPNYTPRISGILNGFDYSLSILKSANADPASAHRQFFEYTDPIPGTGHLIHTYRSDGDPIPSFEGEPVCVQIGDEIDDFTNLLWESLNTDNKVSLFVRFLDPKDGSYETRIINKNV